jgi:hypothetical protein
MIPHQNVGDLMLRKDVVAAIKDRKFHLYQVKTIDQGIELLTGVSAGTQKPDGSYNENTVNFLVDQRLQTLAKGLKDFKDDDAASCKKDSNSHCTKYGVWESLNRILVIQNAAKKLERSLDTLPKKRAVTKTKVISIIKHDLPQVTRKIRVEGSINE